MRDTTGGAGGGRTDTDSGAVLVTGTGYRANCVEAIELLESHGLRLTINDTQVPSWPRQELLDTIHRYDAVVAGLDDWDAEVLRRASRLKVIARFGVGVDNIDVAEAARLGIAVVNAPGQNANAVAEHTVALILSAFRRIPALDPLVRTGAWPRGLGRELSGSTVGLVGFGAIPQLVARRLAGFDVGLLAYDVAPNRERAEELGVSVCDFDDLLGRSDVVSLHVPAVASTHHLMRAETLAAMRDGALLVNTARGTVVDEVALAAELATGRLSAALDVFEHEPLPAASPIAATAAALSPHQAGETTQSYARVALTTARDILAVLDGTPPRHPVV